MPSKNPTTTTTNNAAPRSISLRKMYESRPRGSLTERRIFIAPLRPLNTWLQDIGMVAKKLQAEILGLMFQPDPQFIYIVRCTVTEKVKIGKTCDINKRARNLQAMSPTQLELLAIAPGQRFEEENVHLDLVRHRAHGEWFDLSAEKLAAVLRMFADELARLRANTSRRERRHAREDAERAACQTPEYMEKLAAVAAAMDRRGRP